MESVLTKIIGTLDGAQDELENFDGVDYREFLRNGSDYNKRIHAGLENVSDILGGYNEMFRNVIKKLNLWNTTLKKLVEDNEKEREIALLRKISTDGVLPLTNKEDINLNNQIQARKMLLQKDIYNLINENVSLQNSLQNITDKINEMETLNEDSVKFLADIKRQYQESLEYQETKKSMESQENNFSSDESPLYDEEQIEEIKETNERSRKTENERIPEKNSFKETNIEENRVWTKKLNEEDTSDVDNWNKFKYQLIGGVFPDIELTYVIQAYKNTMENVDDISISFVITDDFLNSISGYYDILSKPIHIEPVGLEVSFNPSIPWRISIPYAIIRSPNREVVIFCRDETNQQCIELDTQEILYEESREEGIKFAEASLPSMNCICVVVSKRRVEKFEINKKGITIESKVDDRIAMILSPASVMIGIQVHLMVQPIESGLINELKTRIKSTALNGIQTISPIIELNSDWQRRLLKPGLLQIPIPYPAGYVANKNRIFSAGPIVPEKIDRRPKTALTRQISNETNSYIKLAWFNEKEKTWKVKKEVKPNLNKNGDSMTIDLEKLEKQKIVALRCTEDLNDEKIQKALEIIEDSSEGRSIQFIFGQRIDDPNRIILATGPPNKIEKIHRLLVEQGYNEETSAISPEFVVRERDNFQINFRGNLLSVTESEIRFIYNSQLPNRVEFYVKEKDKFAQKNKDSFQGYISLVKLLEKSQEKLWEIVINIPKFDQEINKSLHKDFNFKPTDCINKEYLSFLSNQIGEDWRKLGRALRISDESIKRIANDPRQNDTTMAYECLLKWIKNTTVYSNKTEIIEKALRNIGRQDLAKDLIYRTKSNLL